jgi:serine/threonine protein phosphatase 1
MSGTAPRTIAIGDVHGYLAALDGLIGLIEPRAEDTLVVLGDYIDRGPDGPGVFDRLIELGYKCRLVPILGNHDELLLAICEGHRDAIGDWLRFGGDTTFRSYDGQVPEAVPDEHVDFLRGCRDVYETATHFFVHGNYLEQVPLAEQPADVLRWRSIREHAPGPHVSGKKAVVGHTAQHNGEVLDLGHLICIDTYIYGDGWLTALDVDSGQIWQVDQEGQPRGT